MTKSQQDTKPAHLQLQDEDYELAVYEGSIGPSVIDVARLYSDTGQFTYGPGYTSTGSCRSTITDIDGEEGILLHRGYPI